MRPAARPWSRARTRLEPADSSLQSFGIADQPGGGRTCTGDLSIRENASSSMWVYQVRDNGDLHQVASGTVVT